MTRNVSKKALQSPSRNAGPEWITVAQNLIRHRDSRIYYLRAKCKGKQLKRSLSTKDRKLADRRLREELLNIERDLSQNATLPKSTSLNDLIAHWSPARKLNLKEKSASRIDVALKGISKTIGDRKVSEISHKDVDYFAAKRLRYISDSSAKKERDELISLLDYAKTCGLIKENLARPDKFKGIRGIAAIKVKNKELSCPTTREFEEILKTVRSFNNLAPDGIYRPSHKLDPRTKQAAHLLQLLAYSGMRLNEAVNIRWNDIVFDGTRPTLRIDGGKQGTKNGLVRTIPLFPKLSSLLLEIRDSTKDLGDKVITIKSARKALLTSCVKTGLGPYTQHSLRHYFASEAVQKGIDFKTISEWLGHKDGGMLVAKTYSHLRDDHSWEMAQKMI